MKAINLLSFAFLFVILLSSCTQPKKKDLSEVIIWELADADMLNPINYTGAEAGYITGNMFQSLLGIDPKTLETVPLLAVSRPEIETPEEGGMLITYRIRPEARWDNGEQITAKDVEFTLKVIKNPKVNNQHSKPYYEFIEDIKFDEDDPLKYTLVCNEVYILAETASGGFPILSAYIYDPKGLMQSFTISQLNNEKDALSENQNIIEFAQDFNSEKYQREKTSIIGSGPYLLDEWITGQRIVLKKKENWWGDHIKEEVVFQAYPPKLIYQVINDQTTAIVALKAGNIDVMQGIPPKDFIKLPESEKFAKNYYAHAVMSLSYSYIGINTKKPILADKLTRQALAHIVDVDKIIEIIYYGLADRINGPIHPSKKKQCNFDIKPYPYDLEKAKELLAQAGWKDSDGNGILDKEIDGELKDFEIEFMYNSGNDQRKQIALMFQEDARNVGIKVNVLAKEWSIFLDESKEHNFDLYIGAWISSPTPNDHKQIFHTSSYNDGSNYTGFGNEETDALIDSIRVELNEDKRAVLNKKFQRILYDETSYIFLAAGKSRLAIHKRFDNAEPTVMRPGYYEPGFILRPEASAK